MRFRVQFKTGLLTYKTLKILQPEYLYNLISLKSTTGRLRSASDELLNVPRTRSKTGAKAFVAYAPRHWNSLPLKIRKADSVSQFKKLQKTYLFDLAFPP